jgi:hypothetical protein
MKGDTEALQFEFTSEQKAVYVPQQKLVSVDGYFHYGKHSGKHIASVPSDYLASRIAMRLGEAILMQEELNRRHSEEIFQKILDEPDPAQSVAMLSDYINR